VLKVSNVGVKDNFFELGGNSLMGVALIGNIEAKFGIRFPFSTIFSAPTIRDLSLYVGAANADLTKSAGQNLFSQKDDPGSLLQQLASNPLLSELNTPVVVLQRVGTKPPIFFIHPAFKTAVCYGALAYLLGPEQPVYGIEPRRNYESIEEMATDYIKSMRTIQPHGPYRIAGWSFGGLIAFEIALQLEAQGERISFFSSIDGRAPIYSKEDLAVDIDALVLCTLCKGAINFLGFSLEVSYSELLPLSADERLLRIIEKAVDNEILDKLEPAVASSFFFRFRKDIKDAEVLARKYNPKNKLNCTIIVLRSTRSAHIEGLADAVLDARTLGWDSFASSVKVVDINDSDHYGVVFQPQVQNCANSLRGVLENVV